MTETVALSALLAGTARGPAAPPEDGGPIQAAVAARLLHAGRRLDALRLVPATSGNLSERLDDGDIAITRSGCHKGFLTADDILRVDAAGAPRDGGRPSAETLLHCQIYAEDPDAGAVLHAHPLAATVLTRDAPGQIDLTGYEVLKAFAGIKTHAATVTVPVFANDQNIPRLAAAIAPWFARGMPGGYAISGHGVYAWGPVMEVALARLEALDFLLTCEWERRKAA